MFPRPSESVNVATPELTTIGPFAPFAPRWMWRPEIVTEPGHGRFVPRSLGAPAAVAT